MLISLFSQYGSILSGFKFIWYPITTLLLSKRSYGGFNSIPAHRRFKAYPIYLDYYHKLPYSYPSASSYALSIPDINGVFPIS